MASGWHKSESGAARPCPNTFIKDKELDGCHTANEFLMLSMVLDRWIRSVPNAINTEGVEIICRRLHGIRRAFGNVKRQADWKQPRGQGGQKWKSKVNWELCDQYDIRALDAEELIIPDADEEVRHRLERMALFQKYLDKANVGVNHEDDK